jgi:hypothetical protein
VGRALDPETVRGQIVGGVAMGVSQTLFERIAFPDGKANVVTLHAYHVVTSLDARSSGHPRPRLAIRAHETCLSRNRMAGSDEQEV